MQSQLLRMHEFLTLDFQCQFVNILLNWLEWPSQFIIHMSSLCLNIEAKQMVVEVKDSAV